MRKGRTNMPEFRKLFEPIKVGKIELKNRLVMLAIGTGYVKEGKMTPQYRDFIVERAKGGVGLVITSCSPSYGEPYLLPQIKEDEAIPSFHELVQKVHKQGTKVVAQLIGQDKWAREEKAQPEFVAPSQVLKRPGLPGPRPLKVEEIHLIVEEFGEAACRAREAGFDGVEFHAGMGFLLNQFLSPCTNKRADQYGGNLENRMRMLLEVIKEAKKKAGEDYTLLCRISGEEFMEGGLSLKETKEIAKILEREGIKCLDVQAGWHESRVPLVQNSVPRGAFIYIAEEIKKAVNIPVIAAYRINEPFLAEEIIAQGKADLIGMARALIADPEFPKKAQEGRVEEIRPCLACCRCLDNIFMEKPLACTVNPLVGKEGDYFVKLTSEPKKVLILGGGPGGMQAATIAAQRGHEVILWEKEGKLGGQLLFASLPPYKEEIERLNRYLVKMLENSGVKISLRKKGSTEEVIEEKPDVVVIATGASPIIPSIPGIEGKNVVTALEVLSGAKEVGERVIIVGGGMVGCETAEFLAQRAKKVVILEMLGRMGNDIGPTTRWVVLRRLKEASIRTETKAEVMEINEKGVRVRRNGNLEFFEGDTVILAVGMKANNEIKRRLEGKVKQLEVIGDCVKPRRIKEAVEEGFEVGIKV